MPSIGKLLCASLAGFSIGSAAPHHRPHRGEKPREITEVQWNDIVKYTKYAAAAYQYPCPNPPNGAVVHKYIDIQNTTTQAYIFRSDVENEFVLAFPGTRGPTDQAIDEDYTLTPISIPGMDVDECEGCEVHAGYMSAWQSISQQVTSDLMQVHKEHMHYNITIVGHSLGGAMASLSTMSLRQLNFPITRTFSFGQPRTGNKAFADRQDALNGVVNGSPGHFHRVVHAADGVPHWPARSYGYHHHSTQYWERNIKHPHTVPHVQSRARTFRCFGQEAPNCADMEHPKTTTNPAHVHYSNILMGDPAICAGGT